MNDSLIFNEIIYSRGTVHLAVRIFILIWIVKILNLVIYKFNIHLSLGWISVCSGGSCNYKF